MSVESTIRDTYDTVFGGEKNLSTLERATSVGLGLIMAAAGVNRADLPGAIMGLAGAALVGRGMSGHCAIKAALTGHDGQHRIDYGDDDRMHAADTHDRAMTAHAM